MTARTARTWRWLAVWAGLVAMGLAAPNPATAQSPLSRLEGSRLRVTVWNTPLPSLAIGTLTGVTGDTLVLTPPDSADILVPFDRILRVDQLVRPERPDGGREGFLIGAGVAVMMLKTAFDAHYANDDYNLYAAVLYGVPLGGTIGAIIGSERAKEKWVRVEMAPATGDRQKRPSAGRIR